MIHILIVNFLNYLITFKALTNAITNSKLPAASRYSAREYGYADAVADAEHREVTDDIFCE